jgi:hypothetical protein
MKKVILLMLMVFSLSGCTEQVKTQAPKISNFNYNVKYYGDTDISVIYKIDGTVEFEKADAEIYKLRVKIGGTQYEYGVQWGTYTYNEGIIGFYGYVYIDKQGSGSRYYRVHIEDADGLISNVIDGELDVN